jgi:Mrp family chromosome partitioning ATPase
MSKIRELLRHPGHIRKDVGHPVAVPRAFRPDEDERIAEEEEVEIPYIEVGGPKSKIDASASVLASRTVTKKPLIPPKDNQEQLVVETAPAPPPQQTNKCALRGVVFRPYPPERPPLRPAAERFIDDLVAFHQPENPVSEHYRVLLDNLESQLPAGQAHCLLFSSPTPSTDTTTVLLNIAVTWARAATSKICIVDANLRRPSVSECLGMPMAPGLRDVLAGKVSLQNAVQETGLANLSALTAGKAAFDNPGLLAGESMRAILRHLRARFEWILIDAPCWDGRPDVVALGSACDSVYLVLTEEESNKPHTQDLMDLIQEQGSRLRGCVMMRA